jgi:hypothetical protein
MAGAVIATALPPQAVLQLFTGLSAQSAIARDEFTMGMSTVFQIASAISAVGTLASLVRGRESTNEMEESHRLSGVVET